MTRREILKSTRLLAAGSIPFFTLESAPANGIANVATSFAQFTEIARNVYFARGNTSYFQNGDLQHAECNNGFVIFDRYVLVIVPDRALQFA